MDQVKEKVVTLLFNILEHLSMVFPPDVFHIVIVVKVREADAAMYFGGTPEDVADYAQETIASGVGLEKYRADMGGNIAREQ